MADMVLVLVSMPVGAAVAYAVWAMLEGPAEAPPPVIVAQSAESAATPSRFAPPETLTLDAKLAALTDAVEKVAKNQEEMITGRTAWEGRLLEEMRAVISVQDPEFSATIQRLETGIEQIRDSVAKSGDAPLAEADELVAPEAAGGDVDDGDVPGPEPEGDTDRDMDMEIADVDAPADPDPGEDMDAEQSSAPEDPESEETDPERDVDAIPINIGSIGLA